ncbi:MAG: hypothetical protein WCO96_03575 [Actinomycetes bacterium]
MKVLYVLERYPELSQTFVVKEIEALIAAGVDVSVAAIAPGLGGDAPAPALWTTQFGARERLIEAGKAAASAPGAVGRQLTREASWPPPGGSRRLRGLLRLAPFVRPPSRAITSTLTSQRRQPTSLDCSPR